MKRKIKDVEAELGSTPEEVAQSLHQAGIKGFRKSPKFCPIANYFNQHCLLWPGADFQPGAILYHDAQILDHHFGRPVTEMMKRFDAGEFPELALELE